MNKKESREVIRWEARLWESKEQEAQEERKRLEMGSWIDSMGSDRAYHYCTMKRAVLMVAVSLKIITQEECDRCIEEGVDVVLKAPEHQKAGGG